MIGRSADGPVEVLGRDVLERVERARADGLVAHGVHLDGLEPRAGDSPAVVAW